MLERPRLFGRFLPQKILRVCTYCKGEFETIQRDIRMGRKFCSLRCYHRSKRIRKICMCESCKKEFSYCRSRYKKDRRFCSLKCYWEIYKINIETDVGIISFKCPHCRASQLISLLSIKRGNIKCKYCNKSNTEI